MARGSEATRQLGAACAGQMGLTGVQQELPLKLFVTCIAHETAETIQLENARLG